MDIFIISLKEKRKKTLSLSFVNAHTKHIIITSGLNIHHSNFMKVNNETTRIAVHKILYDILSVH